MAEFESDFAFALHLQSIFDGEIAGNSPQTSTAVTETKSSIVDQSWELIDPTPDIHAMFIEFNKNYFWGKLGSVEIRWSPRMTLCAGVCSYQKRGLCSIRLSSPLLKLRPRKDLVETMLHEMIHAYLFITDNNKDRDGHGPEFVAHMNRINQTTGTKITIFHSFHDEVKNYRTHWWKCDGPCQHRRPFFGMVKRAMNRAPGPSDNWWKDHQASCGGTYTKIKEPEGFAEKKRKGPNASSSQPSPKKVKAGSIVPFSGKGQALGGPRQKETIEKYLNGAGPSKVRVPSRQGEVIVIEDGSPDKREISPRKTGFQTTLDRFVTKSPR